MERSHPILGQFLENEKEVQKLVNEWYEVCLQEGKTKRSNDSKEMLDEKCKPNTNPKK